MPFDRTGRRGRRGRARRRGQGREGRRDVEDGAQRRHRRSPSSRSCCSPGSAPGAAPRSARRPRRTSSSSCASRPPSVPQPRSRSRRTRRSPPSRAADRRWPTSSVVSSPASPTVSPKTSPRCCAAGWWSVPDDRHLATMGVRKAAIVLIQLGRTPRPSVLSHLSDTEVEAISAEIARLDYVDAEESAAVLEEFREMAKARANWAQGGLGVRPEHAGAVPRRREGRRDHGAAPGRRRPDAVPVPAPGRPGPAAHLHRRRAPPGDRAGAGAHDAGQGVAGALRARRRASRPRSRTGSRSWTGPPPRSSASVEANLERKLSSVLQPSEMSRVGGVDPLVNIINRSDRLTERQIVEGLEALDADLADEVRSRMFMFEDIVHLEDRSVQLVVRQVVEADLALALKGVSEAVRTKITSNLSTAPPRTSSRRSSCSAPSAWSRSRRPSSRSSGSSASSRSRARSRSTAAKRR